VAIGQLHNLTVLFPWKEPLAIILYEARWLQSLSEPDSEKKNPSIGLESNLGHTALHHFTDRAVEKQI